MIVKIKYEKDILKKIASKQLKKNSEEMRNYIQDTVQGSLFKMINFSSPDADHEKLLRPNDSVMNEIVPDFAPLDEITKIRRKAFMFIGVNLLAIANRLKRKTIKNTKVVIHKSRVYRKIYFKVVFNYSSFLKFMRMHYVGSLREPSQVSKEYRFMAKYLNEHYVGKGNYQSIKDIPVTNPVKQYYDILGKIIDGEIKIKRIPVRRFGKAAIEQIRKSKIDEIMLK